MPGSPPQCAAGLTSGCCRHPGTLASRCELQGEERGAVRVGDELQGGTEQLGGGVPQVRRGQHSAGHPHLCSSPAGPLTLDLVEVTGLLLGEEVGMGVLAGIHLVHEEGAEPAALGIPGVPPTGQGVSAGTGEVSLGDTPSAGGDTGSSGRGDNGKQRPRCRSWLCRQLPAPSILRGGGGPLGFTQFTSGGQQGAGGSRGSACPIFWGVYRESTGPGSAGSGGVGPGWS